MTRRGAWRGPAALALAALALAALACGCSPAGRGARSSASASQAVRLAPDPAYASSCISVAFDDASLDPRHCRYAWRRNGMAIANAAGRELDPPGFARGDRVEVVVTTEDAAGGPARTLKAEAVVANSPPRIARTTLVLAAVAGATAIQAQVECSDPDGDTPAYAYRWFRNGRCIDGADAASLPVDGLARDDHVVVEVVARDGESSSAPVRSDELVLENRPPRFTSQPDAPGPADDTFRYQAAASDPDGDALHFELSRAPEGMSITPRGAIEWALPPAAQRQGEYAVAIRASDGKGGEAIQEFTLRLDAHPRAR